jgi:hypothetical protein
VAVEEDRAVCCGQVPGGGVADGDHLVDHLAERFISVGLDPPADRIVLRRKRLGRGS